MKTLILAGGIGTRLDRDPSRLLLLTHEKGVPVSSAVQRMIPNKAEHDPSDIHRARELAEDTEKLPVGLLFQDASRPRYDTYTTQGVGMSSEEKLANLERELDRLSV